MLIKDILGFFHGNESISTTKYIAQISPVLMHIAAVEISSSVQAKHRLLFTPAVCC